MTDVHDTATRSYNMAMIRCSDTKPEVLLRKTLWHQGLRYSLNSRLPGKPDLVFSRFKAVVFVDGCFWHACPKHLKWPKSNAVFWKEKITANKKRDVVVNKRLHSLNWNVIRIWEHEIKSDVERCARRVEHVIRHGSNLNRNRKLKTNSK